MSLRPSAGSGRRELVEWRSAWSATSLYLAATVALTWPAATGLTRNIPWDLGDSLLNCWILGWDANHLLRFLTGDIHALSGFWSANIFGREPLTLAYSDHLLAQAVTILPVYAATKNLILCYNLLFLSSFVLSALGTYLLVRDLTDHAGAAFVAGLIYAFALYRLGQFSHVQVLSSQWMPFVLFAFRRYFVSRAKARLPAADRRLPSGTPALIGGSLAFIAQNLSCGYYLFFFFPFVIAFVLFEIGRRHLWRDRQVWIAFSCAALAVLIGTVPFLLPYLELRRLGMQPRPIEEVMAFSADVYSYLTAHWFHHLYGNRINVFPKPEGELFTGFIAPLLAAIALIVHLRSLWQRTAGEPPSEHQGIARTAAAIVVAMSALLINILLTTGLDVSTVGVRLRVQRGSRPLLLLIVALAVWGWYSPRVRRFLRGIPGAAIGFYAAAVVASFWLSLGPVPTAMGHSLHDPGLYLFFYKYVPGFNGLRVPARFGMLFMLFLAVLAGFGVRHVAERPRYGAIAASLLGILFLMEAYSAPIIINGTPDSPDLATPPPYVLSGPDTFPVYRGVSSLPADALIAEFPFGNWQYELRYMYYSTTHWRRLLNGYSGQFPDSYIEAVQILRGMPDSRMDDAWPLLTRAGVTHAIVHEAVFLGDKGARTSAWLRMQGAREIASYGADRIFELHGAQERGTRNER